MASYESIAKKFSASEERLFALLDELQEIRNKGRACNYTDHPLAVRCERVFDEAEKERKIAQDLFDKLTELHKEHWRKEYKRQIALAREAVVPLARAWRIAHRAFGEIGHFPVWVDTKFSGEFMAEILVRTEQDKIEIPLDPPGTHIHNHSAEHGFSISRRRNSFALTRAENELRC